MCRQCTLASGPAPAGSVVATGVVDWTSVSKEELMVAVANVGGGLTPKVPFCSASLGRRALRVEAPT